MTCESVMFIGLYTRGVSTAPLSPTEFSSAVTAITSAFGDPTRREIYLFAHRSDDGVTTAAVAEHFDLHPNVARHHLDKLAAAGHLEITVDRAATGAGRPSKRYRRVGEEMSLEVPVRTDDVIMTLLVQALTELGPQRAEALAEDVGRGYGQAMASSLGAEPGAGHRSVRAALHTVADALTAHGFAAKADKAGGKLRIVSEHCPFGEAVLEHPVMCAIDRGMVRGMLGSLYGETSLEVAASKPMGDDVCVTNVESEAPADRPS